MTSERHTVGRTPIRTLERRTVGVSTPRSEEPRFSRRTTRPGEYRTEFRLSEEGFRCIRSTKGGITGGSSSENHSVVGGTAVL